MDQAVLLAKLLKDGGYDARVVRGMLDQNQALRLLEGIDQQKKSDTPIGNIQTITALINDYSTRLGFDAASIIESLTLDQTTNANYQEYDARTNEEQKFLLSQLPDHGLGDSSRAPYEGLLSEAQQYFWVQYRSNSGQQWLDKHPALTTGTFGAIKAEEFFSKEIPPKLQHRFAFEVVASQEKLGKIAEHVIVPKWERPAANLIDADLTFSLYSKHLATQASNGEALKAPVDLTDVLIPTFNGTAVGKAIDLYGNPIDLDAASAQFAGVFQQIMEKGHKAATALSALGSSEEGDQKNLMFLKNVRIDFYLTKPGGEVKQYSRLLFADDGNGFTDPERRDEQFSRLTRFHSLKILTGEQNKAYQVDQSLSTMISNFEYLMLLYKSLRGGNVAKLTLGQLPKRPWKWAGLDLMTEIFDGVPTEAHQVLYRPEPTLFMHSKSIGVGEKELESIDILQNTRQAIDVQKKSIDPELLMKAGIWDSITEGSLIGPLAATRYDISTVFQAAETKRIRVRTFSPHDINELNGLSVADFAKDRIKSDLNEGYSVVVPEESPFPDSGAIGWWRIDTNSGATQGMMAKGSHFGGAAMTEEQILLGVGLTGALMMVAAVFSYMACKDDDTTCEICAAVGGVLGAAGLVGTVNVPAGVIIGLFAGLVAAVCAIGTFLDWNMPPLTHQLNSGNFRVIS